MATMLEDGYAMKHLPLANVTPSSVEEERPEYGAKKPTRDEVELARFGKRQQLKRNFGLMSIIGLTCTVMITWEGTTTAFQAGLNNGGPAGLVYGYIFAWAGTMAQTVVMAELASMIPISGGQVAIVAPPQYSKLLSYLTGWVTVVAWQAGLASTAFLGGTMIQGLLVLNYPSYIYARWQGTLLFYAFVAVALLVNTYLARLLPQIETMILMTHILGFFAVLIPLVYLGPHGSASDVFTLFENNGGWSTTALSTFVGLKTSMFAFTGVDAAAHMAEEIESASRVLPMSMIATVILNGSLGFAMLIVILFQAGNIPNALATPTGFPFIEIYASATGSNSGASVMTSVIIASLLFATIGLLATASRMTWAFARENGLPFSKYLGRVEPRTSLPLWSIGLSTFISCLLALINIASTTAFNALTGLVIAAFYSSFLFAACTMLHKRLTTPEQEIRWGLFKLGRYGVPITIFSIIYSVIGTFFSFWPPSPEPTPETMNWSIAVFGGLMVFCVIFWYTHAHKIYKGPIIEISGGVANTIDLN